MTFANRTGDIPLADLDAEIAAVQSQVSDMQAGKASVVHPHIVADVTDLPPVDSLRDFSQTVGTRSTEAVVGLESRLQGIEALITQLFSGKVDKAGAFLVNSPDSSAAGNEVTTAAWVRQYVASVVNPAGAPVNTVSPVVTVSGGGSLVVDAVLNASNGTWTGTPTITYAYLWFRNGVAIGGQTTNSHMIVSADLGTILTIRVRASNGVLSDVEAFSIGTSVPAALVLVSAPTFTGTMTVGQTVATDGGVVSPAVTPTVQWMRGTPGVAIVGATNLNYVLTADDQTGTPEIFVRATFSQPGGGVLVADSVHRTIAPSVDPYAEGSEYTATSNVKAIALDSLATEMYLAQNHTSAGDTPTVPAWRSKSTSGSTYVAPPTLSSTPEVALPSGCVQNDTVLLMLNLDNAYDTPNITWPSGTWGTFVQLENVVCLGWDGGNLKVAWCRMSATPPSTFVVTMGGAHRCVLEAHAFSGTYSVTPIDVSAPYVSEVASASPVSIGPVSATSNFANDLGVLFVAADTLGADLCTDWTAPSGWDARTEFDTGGSGFLPLAVYTKTIAAAGAVSATAIATLSSGTSAKLGVMVLLRGVPASSTTNTGAVRVSARSGSDWATAADEFVGDGVVATVDEGYFTGLAASSDGNSLVVGAAANGYAGPGYLAVISRVVSSEVAERWIGPGVGDDSDLISSAWPDALATNGTTIVALLRGSVNQLWTYDGETAVHAPSATPISAASTPAFGNRVALDDTGLKMAAVIGSDIKLYIRGGTAANWSEDSTLTPSAAPISVAMSRAANVLAVGTNTSVIVYAGGYGAWVVQQIIPVTGGRSLCGRGIALSVDGSTLIFTEETTTSIAGSSPTQYRTAVRTFIR